MLEWMKKRGATVEEQARPEATVRRGSGIAGKYRTLYEYLDKRYANTVVLTFGQVEDLLGFSLPDLASTDPAWWTSVDIGTTEARCSDAWTLSRRTATPNLGAKTVAFERES
jgi:hypothetical protein